MGTWKRLESMPDARFYGGAAAVDGKIYFIGGGEGIYARNGCYVYDIETDQWSRFPDLPQESYQMGIAVHEGKIYSFGGYNNYMYSQKCFVYDIAARQWSAISDMPGDYNIFGCQKLGEQVYLHSQGNQTMVYDIPTDSWSLRQSGPLITEFSCAGVDGDLYYFGGRGSATSIFTPLVDTLYHYDTQADSWSTRAPMPQVRGQACGVVNNGLVYCVGGYQEYENGQEGVGQKGVYNPAFTAVYNPANDQWETVEALPELLRRASAVSSGGKVYVMGGIDGSNGGSRSLYEYQPDEEGGCCEGCEQVTIKITGSKCSQLIKDVCKLVDASGCDCRGE